MTIIVFLIDTSASMFQRTYIGGRTTILDVAKSAVETFVKIRQRSMDSRIDRYMLLTFEETPNNIKAGWKENLATFMNELKNLQCYTMTTMGVAVKQAFDILNINRMTSGIDTYGQGRCPFFLETSIIVLITDGGKLTTVNGVQEEFNLPMHSPIPGSEMTREPFRWDQRLFALVLRLSGTPAVERDTGLVPSDTSPIDAMCEVTGGRSYCITSHRMLNQCIDSLVQKVQNGVVINFEKIGPDPPPPDDFLVTATSSTETKDEPNQQQQQVPPTPPVASPPSFPPALTSLLPPPQPMDVDGARLLATLANNNNNTSWHSCRRMIYVPKSNKSYCVGFWPIPESFWPEVTASVLPARSAHPNVKFTCTSSEPLVIENLPFDKYELEPSPLTQYILSRKQPKICWQVFVANSYKNSEVGHPFGYLKASTNLTCVNLFVMPYNYPVLLPLLDELSKVHRWKPTNEWRTQFQNYMRTLPAYYAGPLRRALTRMGTPLALAQTLIPESSETLSYSVSSYLKRLKNQAKVEFDKLCGEIQLRQNAASKMPPSNSFNQPDQIRVVSKASLLKKDLVTHPLLHDKFSSYRDQISDHSAVFVVTLERVNAEVEAKRTPTPTTAIYKNPFDVPRQRLIEDVLRTRHQLVRHRHYHHHHHHHQPDPLLALSRLQDNNEENTLHTLPISQMGNYQEYLKRQPAQLREIESAPVRQHMFGNPFKIDKRMMVDEADIDLVVGQVGGNMVSNSANNAVQRNNKRSIATPEMTVAGRLPKRKPGPLPRNFAIRRNGLSTVDSDADSGDDLTAPPTPTAAAVLSPIPWLPTLDRDNLNLPSFEERPLLAERVNGLESPCSGRSRSPSPPPLLPPPLPPAQSLDVPCFNSTNSNNSNANSSNSLSNDSVINAVLSRHHNNSAAGVTASISNTSNNNNSANSNSNNSGVNANAIETSSISWSETLPYFGFDDRPNSICQILRETNNLDSSSKTPVISNKMETCSVNSSVEYDLRLKFNRLVRRPGKNFSELFDNLKTLKGTVEHQVDIIRLIIKESLRFKRVHLVELLEQYIQTLRNGTTDRR